MVYYAVDVTLTITEKVNKKLSFAISKDIVKVVSTQMH